MKKLVALVLALALCLSLCSVTAFGGTINTIGDVLATVPGGFPSSSNFWTNEKSAMCDANEFILEFYTVEAYECIDTSKTATLNSDGNYVCGVDRDYDDITDYTITFYMNAGDLTSIELKDYPNGDILNGTYTPPATPIDSIDLSNIKFGEEWAGKKVSEVLPFLSDDSIPNCSIRREKLFDGTPNPLNPSDTLSEGDKVWYELVLTADNGYAFPFESDYGEQKYKGQITVAESMTYNDNATVGTLKTDDGEILV